MGNWVIHHTIHDRPPLTLLGSMCLVKRFTAFGESYFRSLVDLYSNQKKKASEWDEPQLPLLQLNLVTSASAHHLFPLPSILHSLHPQLALLPYTAHPVMTQFPITEGSEILIIMPFRYSRMALISAMPLWFTILVGERVKGRNFGGFHFSLSTHTHTKVYWCLISAISKYQGLNRHHL